jgi:hypothetical protein
MIRLSPTIALVLLFLTACRSGMPERPGDALFGRLPGGEFTLHRDVVIAPGRTRIVFQNGTAAHGGSEYEPRCELEVERILDTPQTVAAGSYRIGKVLGMQRYVNRPPVGSVLAAGSDPLRLADDTTSEWYMHTYRMQLLGGARDDSLHLVCGGAYNYPFYARYPTLQEIHNALGDYATLVLKQ